MDRVTEIEQNIRPGQTSEEFRLRNSDATERVEVVSAFRILVVKQTIAPAESVEAQLSLEVRDFPLVVAIVPFARHVFEPDRILFQSTQAEQPLQRHGEIAAAMEIFSRKTAANENSHASRVINLLACSSLIMNDASPART